ncbi:hypothetical protein H0H93_015452, partial [Arthromyces matolae]
LQFAKLSGFSPVITTASLKHSSFLKELGATHVLDRNLSTSSLSTSIHKITSEPLDFVYDAVSLPETQATGYSLLAKGGTLILVNRSQIQPVEGKHVFTVIGIWTYPYTKDLGALFYAHLTELLENGIIRPNRVEILPGGLGGIVDGLKKLENGQVSGVKLVVRPQETA